MPQKGQSLNGLDFPDDKEIAYYKVYRDQIVCEDNLVYHRMSWLLVAQSILFVTWVAFLKLPQDSTQVHATWGFSLFGIILCLPVFGGVWAAQSEIKHLRERYKENHPLKNPDSRLPSIVGNPDHHMLGKWVPYALILIFGLAWGVVWRYFG